MSSSSDPAASPQAPPADDLGARRSPASGSRGGSSWRRAARWVIPALVAIGLGLAFGAGFAATIDVPEVESIIDFSPGLVTELEAVDGRVFQTYFRQRRVMLGPDEIPELLRDALLAAEDSNFFQHGGVDLMGILSTVVDNMLRSDRRRGASTLTMQLAGSLYLDRTQRTWERKIREAFYAVELEKTLSKQQILTLYCNWVNLGHGNYGFEAAANYYFDLGVDQLDAAQMATLVAIVPRPSDWSPIRRPDFMRHRRDLVLARMVDEGALEPAEYEAAVEQPLDVVERTTRPDSGAYFAEAVRRELYDTYGEKGLYERGLRVHTTFEPRIQAAVDEALRDGLVRIDRETRGWQGAHLQLGAEEMQSRELPSWSSLLWEDGAWVEGIVVARDAASATVRVADQFSTLERSGIGWTRKGRIDAVLDVGDVAWFALRLSEEAKQRLAANAAAEGDETEEGETVPRVSAATEATPETGEVGDAAQVDEPPPIDDFELELMQEPEIEGAVVVLDNASGAVRALGGGWSFARNEFNRALQARRQPGSAFKPLVFGAAYEAGFTPADTLFDAPVVFPAGDGSPTYSPRNFYRNYEGIITLRRALEKSINVTAVKLQNLVGVQRVIEFARRCGIQSPLPPYPSLALGSAELTPLELASAYAAIANEGTYLEPYLIERVETPDGRTLQSHQPSAARAMDPAVAYLLVHTMRGVVDRGTAAAARPLGLAAAGKAGTTDGFTDAWFAGFNPDLTVVVWVGYDRKRRIGRNMTGAHAALPIWMQILRRGLDEGWVLPAERRDFQVPPGIIFRAVEPESGRLAGAAAPRSLQEAFLVGTEPVQEYTQKWGRVLDLPWYQQRRFYGKPKDGERMPEEIEDWDAVLTRRAAQ